MCEYRDSIDNMEELIVKFKRRSKVILSEIYSFYMIAAPLYSSGIVIRTIIEASISDNSGQMAGYSGRAATPVKNIYIE